MKARRMLTLLIACLMLVSVFGVTAFASETKPYKDYYVTISNGLLKDSSTATITKCGCVPVDNYLKAGIHVQYKTGDQYEWDPSQSTVYINEGTNVESRSQSISVANIVYAYGQFQAQCGDGTRYSYKDTATNE